MRGGVVPPALMLAALACALAFVPRQRCLSALIAALITAFAASQLPLPNRWIEGVFLGLWTSTVFTAASVHFSRRLSDKAILMLSVNGGVWAGASVAIAGNSLDLGEAACCLALVAPGTWLVSTSRGVAVKVVASWLIAIALLAAVLPIVPTPGYAPDHLE